MSSLESIVRHRHLDRVEALLGRYPVVAILGARQVGKTTLAQQLASRRGDVSAHLDLEDPLDQARLADPLIGLQDLRGVVVIDEIQLRPELFPILRVLADRRGAPARFLILGSASPHLVQQSSESLAGRISYYELDGLNLEEAGTEHADRLWIRGGFPRSFLGVDEADSFRWRRDFARTFLERDLPQLGSRVPAGTIGRFWTMLAHRHGDLWNASDFARSFGVSDSTVRRYLDLLVGTFVVRQLRPWHANLGKRQVKSPKVYLSDSGLLHALLNLPERVDVEAHPKLGASWEGFWIESLVARLGADRDECFFWATHAGAELDLLVVRGRRRLGFEIKRTSSPRISHSMRAALESLELDRLDLVHGGGETFPLAEKVRAVAARRLWNDVEPL